MRADHATTYPCDHLTVHARTASTVNPHPSTPHPSTPLHTPPHLSTSLHTPSHPSTPLLSRTQHCRKAICTPQTMLCYPDLLSGDSHTRTKHARASTRLPHSSLTSPAPTAAQGALGDRRTVNVNLLHARRRWRKLCRGERAWCCPTCPRMTTPRCRRGICAKGSHVPS